jgi:hypothetical protein
VVGSRRGILTITGQERIEVQGGEDSSNTYRPVQGSRKGRLIIGNSLTVTGLGRGERKRKALYRF